MELTKMAKTWIFSKKFKRSKKEKTPTSKNFLITIRIFKSCLRKPTQVPPEGV